MRAAQVGGALQVARHPKEEGVVDALEARVAQRVRQHAGQPQRVHKRHGALAAAALGPVHAVASTSARRTHLRARPARVRRVGWCAQLRTQLVATAQLLKAAPLVAWLLHLLGRVRRRATRQPYPHHHALHQHDRARDQHGDRPATPVIATGAEGREHEERSRDVANGDASLVRAEDCASRAHKPGSHQRDVRRPPRRLDEAVEAPDRGVEYRRPHAKQPAQAKERGEEPREHQPDADHHAQVVAVGQRTGCKQADRVEQQEARVHQTEDLVGRHGAHEHVLLTQHGLDG